MKYKVIFLIISHKTNDIRINHFKNNYKKLFDKFKLIKFFFVEYIKSDEKKILHENDYLYIYNNDIEKYKSKGKFHFKLFFKSMEAIKFINMNYDFDFLIRTNLSTLFNIKNLTKYLSKVQKPHCGGLIFKLHENGVGHTFNKKNTNNEYLFLQGTCICMSCDIIKKLVNDYNNNNIKFIGEYDDDVVFGLYLNKRYNLINYNNYCFKYQRVSTKNKFNNLDKYFFYRIKMPQKYSHYDLTIFSEILNILYNIK